jgi:ElaB/YqjD/DUF883 family membrane-anchored ribosome-binding protein
LGNTHTFAEEKQMANTRSRRNGNAASSQIYDDILSIAGGLIRNRKDSGAEQLSSIAEATRRYSDSLQVPHVGAYVSSAADQLDYLSDYMTENDLETMLEDAGDFAKRHPVATMGIAAVAGFGFTRLLSMREKREATDISGLRSTTRSRQARSSSSGRRPPSRAAAARGGRNSRSNAGSETRREDVATNG